MPLIHQYRIFKQDLATNPTVLYVFGDNLARVGYGGQAAECRGFANAVGLPTKRSPREYLLDKDLEEIQIAAVSDLTRLANHLAQGGIVIWPFDGIGTGLANLSKFAPKIEHFYRMEKYKLQGGKL